MKDPESSQENREVTIGSILPGESFGQTFQSRRPGLNGVELWLGKEADETSTGGVLTASLYHAPWEDEPLAQTQVGLENVHSLTSVFITIPVQNDPPGQSYYLELQTESTPLQVFGRQENSYSAGSAYQAGAPIDADASFRLAYRYGIGALVGDLVNWLSKTYLAIPALIVLILPGWLILSYSSLNERYDWGMRVATSIGLSLAIIPILLLWTTFAGLSWNRTSAIVIAGILLLLTLLRVRKTWLSPREWRLNTIAIGLFTVFVCTLIVRLIMVRDLSAPPWVDSVHHGMITRLILEQGQLPAEYSPFLEIDTAQYHSGFHSSLALFTWLSGLDIAAAMLLFGQILNALSVFAVCAFTQVLTRDHRAALFAAGITGFLTPMPAYLTSWGRYTQLAGLLILPPALLLFVHAFERRGSQPEQADPVNDRKSSLASILLAALALAGLWLTHYRAAAFLAALMLPLIVYRAWTNWRTGSGVERGRADLRQLGMILVSAVILTAPWWPATLANLLLPKISAWSGVTVDPFADFSWGYLTAGAGRITLLLAGAGLLWGIVNRQKYAVLLLIWTGILFLAANLGALGLPGAGFVNNTSVEISLFLPISALGGVFLSQVVTWPRERLPGHRYAIYLATSWILFGVLALLGSRALIPILNPTTFLFREADRPALVWVEDNLPAGEMILINPLAWGYGLYAGNDGGYWSVPLAGRTSLPPPVLYGLGNDQSKVEAINGLIGQVIEAAGQPQELWDLLNTHAIHYIFIGVRGGPLSPGKLLESGLFEALYQDRDAWVLQIKTGGLAQDPN